MNQSAKSKLPRILSVALSFLLGLNVVHAETVRPTGVVSSTVKIGNETKKTIAMLTELQSGDVACYLTLKDNKGKEFTELAAFEICEMTQLVGKTVRLSYRIESVIADSCQGDPECKDTRKVALVSAVKALKPAK